MPRPYLFGQLSGRQDDPVSTLEDRYRHASRVQLPGRPAAAGSAHSCPVRGELARQAQNPVADMVSVPFQWNWNFDYGPLEKDQHIINIQPVYPVSLNDRWNLITRTILPVMSQPALSAGESRENGIGDINSRLSSRPRHLLTTVGSGASGRADSGHGQ